MSYIAHSINTCNESYIAGSVFALPMLADYAPAKLTTPGVEPGLSRPRRDVLTTRRCGRLICFWLMIWLTDTWLKPWLIDWLTRCWMTPPSHHGGQHDRHSCFAAAAFKARLIAKRCVWAVALLHWCAVWLMKFWAGELVCWCFSKPKCQ